MASRLASRRGGSRQAGPLKPIALPTVKLEEALYHLGRRIIVGVDEVGRGSIAGPVVAAACRIPPDLLSSASLSEVRDSKQLDDVSRRRIARQISSGCDVAYGAMPPELIDRIGIAPATRLAMAAAVDQVSPEPDCVIVDYLPLSCGRWPTMGVAKGDIICRSIAAASIVAKVFRDDLMIAESSRWPVYRWESNKGYATKQHLAAIVEAGPCPIHRRSFLSNILGPSNE